MFLDFERKISRLLMNHVRHCCQYCILCVRSNILRIFFWKVSFFFETISRLWAKNLWHLDIVFGRAVKTAFYLSWGTFSRKICYLKIFLNRQLFPDFVQKLFSFLAKVFGRVVKTAFYVASGAFRGKKLFWKKNCVQFFLTLSRNLWASWEKFLASSPKLHSTWPLEQFEWKDIDCKQYILYYCFRTLCGQCSDFDKKFLAVMSKLHSTCSETHFGKKGFLFEDKFLFILFSVFRQKIFGCVLKTAFYVSGKFF